MSAVPARSDGVPVPSDAEIRAFVRAELDPQTRAGVLGFRRPSPAAMRAWQARLVERGWGAPAWPVDHGGTGWDAATRYRFGNILIEEGAPAFLPFGYAMLAPVLLAVGTAEQKAQLLPRILTLEDWWCQGFSEPGAGSDLAALRTRAERDSDHWIVNGQKTWTTLAQHANRMFCLVRTDPQARPQQGISFLLLDMASPGVTVRPIITMDGGHSVNEVFLDNVRVPVGNLVGAVNQGWSYAKLLLGHERSAIAQVAESRRNLALAWRIARDERDGAFVLADLPEVRAALCVLAEMLDSLEMAALAYLAEESSGQAGGIGANVLKVRGTEIQQRLSEILMELAGPYALRFRPEALVGPVDPPVGPTFPETLAAHFLMTRAVSIYGGSNEIQRTVIAANRLRDAR